MITISFATINDFQLIRDMVIEIWPNAYGKIISQDQIDYMIDLFYSDSALLENTLQKGHQFILAKENDKYLGFASFEHNFINQMQTRLHKLYVLPESQGKGIGKVLIEAVEYYAKENQATTISLNVNKYNKALHFYLRNNYQIISEEVIDIGYGYVMDDYKMEKNL